MTRLELMLEERGLTVSEFAREIGISQSTVYRIVMGETRISSVTVGNFIKIAHGLGLTVEELYFDDPYFNRAKNRIDTIYNTTSHAGRQAMLANALGVEETYNDFDGYILPSIDLLDA